MAELERHAEQEAGEAEDRRRMLDDVQSDKATISRALAQNRTLKDQLAELQNGFVKLVRPTKLASSVVIATYLNKTALQSLVHTTVTWLSFHWLPCIDLARMCACVFASLAVDIYNINPTPTS